MKKSLFILPLLLAAPVLASVANWPDARGVMNTDEVLTSLNTTASSEQRAKLDKIVAERNAALNAANARFSAQLKEILGADDQKLAQKAEEKRSADQEAEKLEQMRRLQPSRYQEMMRRKKAAEKK